MGPKCKTFAEFVKRYESLLEGVILHGYVAHINTGNGERTAHQVLQMQAMDRQRLRECFQWIWDTEIAPPKPPVSPMMQRLSLHGKPPAVNGQGQAQPKVTR